MGLRYLFIVNPVSNRGRAARLLPKIELLLTSQQIDHDYFTTGKSGDAMNKARESAFEYDVIVAVGGDGTVHEVANGLMQARQSNHHLRKPARLGVVPIGSGNDFVKMVGLHKGIDEAIRDLADHRFVPLDIGSISVDGGPVRYFMNNVGIGFDAFVNSESLKIRMLKGLPMYLTAAVKSIFVYPHPTVHVQAGDRTFTDKVLLVNVGNGRCSGGGFYLTPEAKINDGLLDICAIRSLTKAGILTKLPKALTGSHVGLDEVRMFRTQELSIRSDDPLPIHADGEVVALDARDVRIRIEPSALQVMEAIRYPA